MPRKWLAVLAMGVVLAGGCGEPAGPAEFDPVPMEQQLVDLSEGFFERSGPFAVGRFEVEIFLRPVDIDTLVGKTLEFERSPGKFKVSSRTGAPTGASRFLLYRTTTGMDGFSQPLTEIGYLDIWNQSTPQRRQARLVAVVNGETIADYVAFATGDVSNGTWGVTGFAELAGTRADIVAEGLRQTESQGNRYRRSAEIVLGEWDLHYAGTLETTWDGSEPWGNTTTTVLRGAGGQLEMSSAEVEGEFSGTVQLNGIDFATFTGPHPDFVTYSSVGSSVVSPELRSLFTKVVDRRYLPEAPGGLMHVVHSFLNPIPSV